MACPESSSGAVPTVIPAIVMGQSKGSGPIKGLRNRKRGPETGTYLVLPIPVLPDGDGRPVRPAAGFAPVPVGSGAGPDRREKGSGAKMANRVSNPFRGQPLLGALREERREGHERGVDRLIIADRLAGEGVLDHPLVADLGEGESPGLLECPDQKVQEPNRIKILIYVNMN